MTTATSTPALDLPEGVVVNGRGAATAPIDLLDPFQDNPRPESDFDPDRSPQFRELMSSIDQVGVREPIQTYIRGGRLQMKNGHRRRRAAMRLTVERRAAYEARLALPEDDQKHLKPSDPIPTELAPIDSLPIVIVDAPSDEFTLLQDMWLSESERQRWSGARLAIFYKKTRDLAPADVRDDAKWLAASLGLSLTQVRQLEEVVASPVLFTEATAENGSAKLKPIGKEKALRSIGRVTRVIIDDRKSVAQQITGMALPSDARTEAVRAKVLAKAAEYSHPGIELEAIAPTLRSDFDKTDPYTDAELVAWLTLPGMLPTRAPKRGTGGTGDARGGPSRGGGRGARGTARGAGGDAGGGDAGGGDAGGGDAGGGDAGGGDAGGGDAGGADAGGAEAGGGSAGVAPAGINLAGLLLSFLAEFAGVDVNTLSDEVLDTLIPSLDEASATIDQITLAAKRAKRSRAA